MQIKKLWRRSVLCLRKSERKFFRFGKSIFEVDENGEKVEVSLSEFFDYVNETMDKMSKTATTIYIILFGIWGTSVAALIIALISVLK